MPQTLSHTDLSDHDASVAGYQKLTRSSVSDFT